MIRVREKEREVLKDVAKHTNRGEEGKVKGLKRDKQTNRERECVRQKVRWSLRE